MLHKVSPLEFDKNLSNLFRQIILSPGRMFVKKVGEYQNHPVVKMYKRSENNILFSVNDQLFDQLLQKSKYIIKNSDKI